ncbi:MAG: hypothetical protein GX624_06690 [Actinobacteria bacterium]|nr:hypothetical protein [Actinomycetota bacterium]
MSGMKAGQIRALWQAVGGREEPPASGSGALGLPAIEDAAALAGLTLVALGLPIDGPAGAPGAVRRMSRRYSGWLPELDAGFRAGDYGDVDVARDDHAVAFMQAHDRLADILAAGSAPLVLGGSPLVSVPVLQVLAGKLRGRLGVVAFTPAYEVAPVPLYSAQSRWARALELGVVSPSSLVLVGGRAEPSDGPVRRLLDAIGATTFSLADVAQDGMAVIAQEALETAASGTEAVYLSVDVAVLAGVGDPLGLTARELVAGVSIVSRSLLAAADVCGCMQATGQGDGVAEAARVAAEIVAGVAGGIS